MPAVSGISSIREIPASWRAARILRLMFFAPRAWIVSSWLIATYAPLVFLAVTIVAIGSAVLWLAFYANWSYMAGQNLALPIIAFVILAIAVVAIMARSILAATRATRYCSSCLDALIVQKLQRPEELGPHKVKTKKT